MSTPFYDLASLVVVPSGYKASKVYAQKPLTTDGQLAFTRSTTATRVTSTGALETVAANVPRLDYSGGATCPKLLLEPQRTQKLTGSNTFTNVYWNLASQGLGSAPVLTANYGTDPFGGNNAWRVQLNLNGGTDASSRSWILQSFNPSATVTLSMYIKLNSAGTKTVILSDSGGGTVTVNSTSWTRISQVVSGGAGEFRFGLIGGSSSDTLDASICYFQCEEGSYPTSVIVSTTAAVTRGADAASKTGISSLIGQTEGTLFAEVNVPSGYDSNNLFITISDGTSDNMIFMNRVAGKAEYYIANGGVTQAGFTMATVLPTGVHKLAIAYKVNDFAFYVDGVLLQSDTSGSVPACNRVNVGSYLASALPYNDGIKQTLLFTTRLTNAQLAELTTI